MRHGQPGPRPSDRAVSPRRSTSPSASRRSSRSSIRATLDLVPRFEQLRAAAQGDGVLCEGITGELISSEIEIVSGAGADLHDALARQRERRRRLFALADAQGVALGATGTHPWADYREQPIIDTEHYRRVEEGLKYVAWRNNTFSLHVHVGVHGTDRAVRVCDRLRPSAAAAARDLRQLALSGRPRYGAALGADAELHQELSALRRAGCVRRLGGLSRIHRAARAHRLDRRVHAGVVVGQAALSLRHRGGAHLRRAEHRAGVRRARGADGRVHRPGRTRRGRGRSSCRLWHRD